ncbi:MAG: DUF6371 domain-containing protein [Parafilimonas sp.]
MNEHRYILEPYTGMNTRYPCPECNKGKTFSLYIDTETGEHLADHVGRCNRVDNCGNHYTPKQYFQDNNISFDTQSPRQFYKQKVTPPPKPVSFIPVNIFKQSLKNYNDNNFVKFLLGLFGSEITDKLISKYFIGTSKHQFYRKDFPEYKSERGTTVFNQIDITGKIRTGKIMLYNPTTGKRVKEPYDHITWVHKVLKLPGFELKQCFEGEHLLHDKTKPVAITESIKAAIIASVYLPQFIWIAAGSKDGLSLEKCKVLAGRNIALFPDLNGFQLWSKKANEFSHIARFIVSDLLERKATEAEKKQGLDLADYLIRYSYKDFALLETVIQPVQLNKPVTDLQNDLLNIHSKDVISMLGETHTGNDFNKLIIAGIKTISGKVYDLLFDESGELIRPGEQTKALTKLSSFFEKKLIHASFDNNPCWVHIY